MLLGLLLLYSSSSVAQFSLRYRGVDKDSAYLVKTLSLKTSFRNKGDGIQYLGTLPGYLQSRGYASASIDSIRVDSLTADVYVFLGEKFSWKQVRTSPADAELLRAAGWNSRFFEGRTLDFEQLERNREKLLGYLENNGYPFAKVEIDSIAISGSNISGKLAIYKGPLYKIDSVRNLGNARISGNFLQRYLGLPPSGIYRKDKLQRISPLLQELPFVTESRPWTLSLLGTGSVLDLYLNARKSSQVNVLVGLMPSSQQSGRSKMQVTGEANINLRNALGNGETIGLNWQQLQVKSPRLNLSYTHPYLFRSPVGLQFNFDLFKKDSSFVNVNMLAGAQYALNTGQTGTLFIQNWISSLLTVDTNSIKYSRRLPDQADIQSVNIGVNYEFSRTDYRLNPRKGTELNVSVSAGTKNIRKNNIIVELKDPWDPGFNFNSLYDTLKLKSYQFRLKLGVSRYFPVSKASTFKLGFQGGWFSSPDIFRNELFQIGGHKLLRGFDEESIFASGFGVLTGEYRYLLGRNSFLFGFADWGFSENASLETGPSDRYLGAGLGMAFETKAGIFNLTLASGKRNKEAFNLRQSRIHLGFINYF